MLPHFIPIALRWILVIFGGTVGWALIAIIYYIIVNWGSTFVVAPSTCFVTFSNRDKQPAAAFPVTWWCTIREYRTLCQYTSIP